MTPRAIALCVALFASILGVQDAAAARTTHVSLSDLGYRDPIVSNGVYPSATFDIPRFAGLQSIDADLILHISPAASQSSTVGIQVNGIPEYFGTVAQLGRNPHIHTRLTLPATPSQSVAIRVGGYLFLTGDVCADLQSGSLYMTIDPASSFVVSAHDPGGIGGFFARYDNRIAVISRSSHVPLGAVALPYRLRQIEPWHRLHIRLAGEPAPGERTIALEPVGANIERRGDTLFLGPQAVAAIDPRAIGPMMGGGVRDVTLASDARGNLVSQMTLAALGVSPQTASGVGDIDFDVPLDVGALGGMPSQLTFHAAMMHTPLAPGASALVKLFVNGALVGARDLNHTASDEQFTFAIPAAALQPDNTIRLVVSYYTGSARCAGNVPTMTATLLDGSWFSWSATSSHVESIADFLKIAGPRVVVLVAGQDFVPAAFTVLDQLGTLDHSISSIDVQPFTGTIPSGYDDALVFAPPTELTQIDLPVRTDRSAFRIVNPLDGSTVFSATESSGFATMQLARSGATQLLVFSYYRDPEAISRFRNLSVDEAIAQTGNVALLGDTLVSYQVGRKLTVAYAGDTFSARLWDMTRLPLTLVTIAAIVVGLLAVSRRLGGTDVE